MPVQYKFYNGAAPTTAALVTVTTGTAIKTMLQMKGVTGVQYDVVEWGISFDGSAAATPIKCELIETGTVFATVTAAAAADIVKYSDPNAPASTTYFSVGTAATGYTSTAEGTITASRLADIQFIAPTNQFLYQFPLGTRFKADAVSALRIRVTAGAAVNCYCYVIVEV